jgi:tripartite-type tricarboxylate transporter receptor subunit TctC
MTFKLKGLATVLSMLALGMGVLASAQAQNMANNDPKPLRIIVPFAAGGPIDQTVRILAQALNPTLGTIVVDNHPGAGGNLGMALLARSLPDGRTIGVATTATQAINPWLFSHLSFDPIKDFAPITLMVKVPNVVVMNTARAKALGIASLSDLFDYGASHPNALNYGSGGNGSAGHLSAEILKSEGHFNAVHIPFNGAALAQMALMSGQVDFNVDNLASAAAKLKSGQLLALAVTSPVRSNFLPDVPQVAQTLKNFDVQTWWGLSTPANTPTSIVAQLHQAFKQALSDKRVAQQFDQLMSPATPSSPEEFSRLIQTELQKYQAVVKISGAKVD